MAVAFAQYRHLADDLLQSFDRARMSATSPTSTYTLGAELERDRLKCRVSRMTVAIGVLRERDNRRRPGAPQRHLGQVIADFESQIRAMNARLRDLGVDGPSILIRREVRGHRY
jgi:hypothetical protein